MKNQKSFKKAVEEAVETVLKMPWFRKAAKLDQFYFFGKEFRRVKRGRGAARKAWRRGKR